MSAEESLNAHLLADAAVAALVAARIYPGAAPQGVVAPYVTYFRAGGAQDTTFDGPTRKDHPRIQIDAWAATYGGAEALGKAVEDAMAGLAGGGTGGIVRSVVQDLWQTLYEDDTRLHRVSQDFNIWFEEN
jgi:hypothetical protein